MDLRRFTVKAARKVTREEAIARFKAMGEGDNGTIMKTCEILGALMRGWTCDRRELARAFSMTVATADRYLRALAHLPGVVEVRSGRRRLVSFSYGLALRGAGR